jgi:hypothetical protein
MVGGNNMVGSNNMVGGINLDLSKLISFCNSTSNNSTEYNLNLNVDSKYNETSIIKKVNTCKVNLFDEIKKIKSSLLLNEKGVSNKYTFIDLQTVLFNLHTQCINLEGNKFLNMVSNELVLLYPYVLDIPKNEEKIYSLVNSLLLILHDKYAEKNMTTKKEIILTTLDMYKNKINVNKVNRVNIDKVNVDKVNVDKVNVDKVNVDKVNVDKVNVDKVNVDNDDFKKIIFEIANISNINIITIDSLNLSTVYKCDSNSNSNNNSNNKYIILINISDNYYPIYNFSVGYYTNESLFLTYILSLSTSYTCTHNTNKKKDTDVKKKSKKGSSGNDDGQYYDEVITNEDYSLYVSDIVPKKACDEGNKIGKIGENGSDKKKKNSKNIFIKDNDETDEVFNKTETINYVELKKMFSKASKLEEIQTIAIKLGIPIVSGSTKEGKPKNRVKNDIVNDINKLFSMMII